MTDSIALGANVSTTCGGTLCGPCASTGRDGLDRQIHALVLCSFLVFFEELLIDVEIPLRYEPQFKLFKHIDENVPIYKFNGWNAIPPCFFLGL